MAALIIESKNPENLKLLAEIARKMGDKAQELTTDDMEDLILGQMIDKAKTGKVASREAVMKKLGAK